MSRTKTLMLPLVASLAACVSVAARGDDISNPNGMLTASSAADLTAAAVDGALVLGRGMLKWIGGERGVDHVHVARPRRHARRHDPHSSLTGGRNKLRPSRRRLHVSRMERKDPQEYGK